MTLPPKYRNYWLDQDRKDDNEKAKAEQQRLAAIAALLSLFPVYKGSQLKFKKP
jgi:hypothetical protein